MCQKHEHEEKHLLMGGHITAEIPCCVLLSHRSWQRVLNLLQWQQWLWMPWSCSAELYLTQRGFTLSVHQLCSAKENKDHLPTVGLDKRTLKSTTMSETWPHLSVLSCLSVPSTVLGHAPAMMLLSPYLLWMPSVPVGINFFYFPTLFNLNEGDIAGGNSSKYTQLYLIPWLQPRSCIQKASEDISRLPGNRVFLDPFGILPHGWWQIWQ